VTQHLQEMIEGLANRDIEFLETIYRRAGLNGWNRGVRVRADGAALKARGIVGEMLANEAGRRAGLP